MVAAVLALNSEPARRLMPQKELGPSFRSLRRGREPLNAVTAHRLVDYVELARVAICANPSRSFNHQLSVKLCHNLRPRARLRLYLLGTTYGCVSLCRIRSKAVTSSIQATNFRVSKKPSAMPPSLRWVSSAPPPCHRYSPGPSWKDRPVTGCERVHWAPALYVRVTAELF